ncbi:hypothetical protein FH972_014994 [Carpinus fangiana]|uniref:F-box domain-containing protein n=1 Tax=Carpinus fangiana TaxID=176857 RepID=A0A5N6RBA2_9ROSI|nr:hypothetical protein FH972_014994 [Carpinus fangiana]KAE8076335.1 hypothetical protein FH972_014994 [Carpinus fangiana]
MEISHVVENKEHEAVDEVTQKVPTLPPSSNSCMSSQKVHARPPHEALFLVLAYLPLFELLAISEVCVSLRDAVQKDVLPWLNIIVERPLNLRLNDEILMKITSKAIGRLKTLALINCFKISDDGLQWVVDRNPHINKLYIPACTGLTPEGVIRAVKTLSERHHNLKSLRINGIYNIKKEDLQTILSYLQMNLSQQQQQRKQQPTTLYHHRNFSIFRNEDSDPMLDVDICPKCNDVRAVYECVRETCKRKRERLSTVCRGCHLCIPRCEECGRCVGSDELEETACGDNLCSECWLQLPKCNFCNRPYCNQHTNRQYRNSSSTGFVCDVCHIPYC